MHTDEITHSYATIRARSGNQATPRRPLIADFEFPNTRTSSLEEEVKRGGILQANQADTVQLHKRERGSIWMLAHARAQRRVFSIWASEGSGWQ